MPTSPKRNEQPDTALPPPGAVTLWACEPAGGGRLIAHMAIGGAVPLSRAGSQTLRLLIV